ncbi:hypothetical protein D3C77_609250 [compost metagenome]
MQTTTGQQRQARCLGQLCGITHTLHGHARGLILEIPGRIPALAPSPENDNRVSLFSQVRPLLLTQGCFGFQQARGALDHNRQAHQPQTTKPEDKTQCRQPWPGATQPPGCNQQHEQHAGRQDHLFD